MLVIYPKETKLPVDLFSSVLSESIMYISEFPSIFSKSLYNEALGRGWEKKKWKYEKLYSYQILKEDSYYNLFNQIDFNNILEV